jgi:hypothetical protein
MFIIVLVGLIALGALCITPAIFLCKGKCFKKWLGDIDDEVIYEDDIQETAVRKLTNRENREKAEVKLSSPKLKKVIKIAGIVTAVLLLAIFVFVLIFGFKTIRGIGRSKCVANDVINYVEHGGYIKDSADKDIKSSLYIGNLGVMNYVASFRSELNNLLVLTSSMDAIVSQGIV